MFVEKKILRTMSKNFFNTPAAIDKFITEEKPNDFKVIPIVDGKGNFGTRILIILIWY